MSFDRSGNGNSARRQIGAEEYSVRIAVGDEFGGRPIEAAERQAQSFNRLLVTLALIFRLAEAHIGADHEALGQRPGVSKTLFCSKPIKRPLLDVGRLSSGAGWASTRRESAKRDGGGLRSPGLLPNLRRPFDDWLGLGLLALLRKSVHLFRTGSSDPVNLATDNFASTIN